MADTSASPAYLLRRLRGESSYVSGVVAVAVSLGVLLIAVMVVQAVSLARALATLFAGSTAITGSIEVFALATLVRTVVVALQEPVMLRGARSVRRQLRARALQRVFDRGPIGTIDGTVQLATIGIEAIEFYLATYLPALILAVLSPLVVLAWLAWRDWWSFVVILVSLLLLPIFMVLLGQEAKGKMLERWRQQQSLAAYLGDVIRGMGVLRSFNREYAAVDGMERASDELNTITMATLRVAFLSSFALELLSSLATAIVALLLGLRLLNGTLVLSTALAVLLLTPEAFLPLRRAAAQFHASSDGIAAAASLLNELDGSPAAGRVPVPVTPWALTVTYHGVTATCPAEGILVVTGPSGSGKTTLLRALAGLDQSVAASIFVNDIELTHVDRTQWQRMVGYVPQDPRLPGRTIREVLAGESGVPDAELREVLWRVGLEFDLDRTLGEYGGGLSAGQRCRLALAREVLRQPSLLLLDEPLAHLDPTTASMIETYVRSLAITTVVATHRPFSGDATLEVGR